MMTVSNSDMLPLHLGCRYIFFNFKLSTLKKWASFIGAGHIDVWKFKTQMKHNIFEINKTVIDLDMFSVQFGWRYIFLLQIFYPKQIWALLLEVSLVDVWKSKTQIELIILNRLMTVSNLDIFAQHFRCWYIFFVQLSIL